MKNLKIHLVWACAALVFGVSLAQCTSARQRQVSHEREKELLAQIEKEQGTPVAEDGEVYSPGGSKKKKDPKSEKGESPAEKSSKSKKPKKPGVPPTAEEIRGWLSSKSKKSRKRALNEIKRLKDIGLKLQLLSEALSNESRSTREDAVKILGDVPGPEAVRLVIEALRNDGSGQVRGSAVWVLSKRGGSEAISALEQTYWNRKESVYFKSMLAVALNRLGRTAALDEMVAHHSTLVKDIDGSKRESAVRYLAWLGTARVLPPLQDALSDTNSDVRREAVKAIARTRVPEAMPLLERALNDPNSKVADEAKKGIAELKKALRKK